MGLQESVVEMQAAHRDMLDVDAKKTELWDKEDEKFKTLDKAKDQREFDRIKNECGKLLLKVAQERQLLRVAVENWADLVKKAKAALEIERKSFAERKTALEKKAKEILDHNEKVRKFNQTPEGKKNPKTSLDELNVLRATVDQLAVLDTSELRIVRHEALVKMTKEIEGRDTDAFDNDTRKLKEKEFKPKAAKGAKR